MLREDAHRWRPKERMETVAGCRVKLNAQGATAKPPAVTHGAAGAEKWLPFMEMLDERYDVIRAEHTWLLAVRKHRMGRHY